MINMHLQVSRQTATFYLYSSYWVFFNNICAVRGKNMTADGLVERKEKKSQQAQVSINLCANIFSFLLIQTDKKVNH